MADRFAAEIWIGGRLDATLAAPLCQAICEQHVELDWHSGAFEPETADDLLEARVDLDESLVLHLCDSEASFGEFSSLEQFLVDHRIAYTRRSDGKYEFTPELVDFRPGKPTRCIITDHAGNPMAPLESVEPLAKKLKRIEKHLTNGDVESARREARLASKLLGKALPPSLPPLASLEFNKT
jgi:hypothetical protein